MLGAGPEPRDVHCTDPQRDSAGSIQQPTKRAVANLEKSSSNAPKSSAKLLKDRLVDLGLLELDVGRKLYRRKL